MEKRKELIVSAIENGTVIDHIPANKVFEVIKILGLDKCNSPLYFGTNLESKKYGKKGIIKISNKYFKSEEINKIALVAPSATLIEIKDYEVINKHIAETPNHIEGIVKCFNPKCVTNAERVMTKFTVKKNEFGKIQLKCHYCEKFTTEENIEFI